MTSKLTAALILSTLLGAGAPAIADEDIGSYLAARQARYTGDFSEAAMYFTRALASDPTNPELMENAVIARLSLGQIDQALPVARMIEGQGLNSQVANMVLATDEAAREEYAAILDRVESGRAVGPLVDGLLAAWAHVGEGAMSKALDAFDQVAGERGLRAFAIYHKALALASVGDFEGADAIYSGDGAGSLQKTRRGTMAWAEVLSQLERNEDAIALLDETFGRDVDPAVMQMRAALVAGETLPFTFVRSPRDGMAEVFFSVGSALTVDAGEDYALLYSRVAEYLAPDHIDAILLSAELLEALDRYDLAAATYKRVPRDNPAFYVAELGRAETLSQADKTDAAAEVLDSLAETHGEIALVHTTRGDLYRQLDDWETAISAYDAALELSDPEDRRQWFVLYARGICHERLKDWPRAEADFRRALELNPDQPQVLNYLGYSMVEKQINLDEALSMIQRAVEERPQSGYIVDSLGWVLFRLGRYDEAVGHMERAAELMPIDPVVNDHLGDVYWAVGRKIEAEFQWKRALSFASDAEYPEDEVKPDRIRRKLEVGLDAVLAEEGAEPLKVANGD